MAGRAIDKPWTGVQLGRFVFILFYELACISATMRTKLVLMLDRSSAVYAIVFVLVTRLIATHAFQ